MMTLEKPQAEHIQRTAIVQEILKEYPIPENRTSIRPMYYKNRQYRGKMQVIVGYTWLRPGASRYRGVVNDAICGAGETFEAACEAMRKKAK